MPFAVKKKNFGSQLSYTIFFFAISSLPKAMPMDTNLENLLHILGILQGQREKKTGARARSSMPKSKNKKLVKRRITSVEQYILQ